MNYECVGCNYSTSKKSNWQVHVASAKHLKKINSIADNAYKVRELMNKNSILEQKILLLEKTIVDKDIQMNHFLSMTKETGSVVKASVNALVETHHVNMSAISYLTKHNTSAPPLKALDNKKIREILLSDEIIKENIKKNPKKNKEEIISEQLIEKYTSNELVKYLSDLIVKIYKTEDSMKQSIWASDVSRLVYIIRQMCDMDGEWVYDKNALKVRKYIVDPLINEIKRIVSIYKNNTIVNYISNKNYYKIKKEVYEERIRTSANAEKIIDDLTKNNKDITQQIIRAIAGAFYFNKNKVLSISYEPKSIVEKEMSEDLNNNDLNDIYVDDDSNSVDTPISNSSQEEEYY